VLPGRSSPTTCGTHPPEGVWQLDLEKAFAWSCNVAFAELGLAVGGEDLVDLAHRFGFEREINVPGLGSSRSSLDEDTDRPVRERFLGREDGNLARSAFGQGQIQVTPLQMALIPAAIGNKGVIMQPHIVAGWRDPAGGAWISRIEAQPRFDTLLRLPTLRQLHTMMVASTTYGWASTARLNQYNQQPGVAGKTGSAEWSDENDAPHSWFIGYFPAEQPRVALAVLVERGGAGPTVAVRVARHFFGSDAMSGYLAEVHE